MKNWINKEFPTKDRALVRIAAATDRVFALLGKFHGVARFNMSIGVQATASDEMQAAQRDRAKELWGGELAKLMPSMLNAGIAKTKGDDYPPSLGQFIEACKPSPEAAFFEAQGGISARSRGLMGEWTCPAVYWAAMAFGSMELKQAQWNFNGKRWVKCFDDAMAKQEAGMLGEIPPPVAVNARLTHEPAKCDPNVARAAMEKINSMLKKSVGRGVFTFGAPNA
jgi:hypothetical protein